MTKHRVVVTGIGIVCSLGLSAPEVLTGMKAGKTGIGCVTRFSTDRFLSSVAGEIRDLDLASHFDETERARYDRAAMYAMLAADEALQNSGGMDGVRQKTGLVLGTCNGGMNSLEDQGRITGLDAAMTARYPFFVQGQQVARRYGLEGPVITVNTACTAGGNAIGLASDLVAQGYADVMLAGGADSLSLVVYAGFNVLRALHPGPCSPYGQGMGLSLGEGSAVVVLEPLARARARGAAIYGEVLGYGLSLDGYHQTASDPEGKGVRQAVQTALKRSGATPSGLQYVNTHGTGTKANDEAELLGLRGALGEWFADLPLSSSKSYFGHTLGAAGAIEFASTLLALRDGLLPATLHVQEVRDGCRDADLVLDTMRPAVARCFLSTNSAFGGHNSALLATAGEIQDSESQVMVQSPRQRVLVTGMGFVSGSHQVQGAADPVNMADAADPGLCVYALKEAMPALYERRMNALVQFGIGATVLAMQDAGWVVEEGEGRDIGLFFGTARGSLQNAEKYLDSIFASGPEHASGIYFPFMVLNSTLGKLAEKLNLRGFGSSISSGGDDGILSLLYAYESIAQGVVERALAGAGDERSELSAAIDGALGLSESPYAMSDGSCMLALCASGDAAGTGRQVYAELLGFGVAGGQDACLHAMRDALACAGCAGEGISYLYVQTPGTDPHTDAWRQAANDLCARAHVEEWSSRLGYGESRGSLEHVWLAASRLYREGCARARAVVISVSAFGQCTALVLGTCN